MSHTPEPALHCARSNTGGATMPRKTTKVKRQMDFGQRLAGFRKEKSLTQQALVELINVRVIQVRRYEADASQPTLDVIRRLAVALQVSADVLIFGADERGPDGDLRLQFEAISKFASEEKKVIKA